jgi:hypothetical protein
MGNRGVLGMPTFRNRTEEVKLVKENKKEKPAR